MNLKLLIKLLGMLGLKPGASPVLIRQQYRDLVRIWHPDRFASNPELRENVQEKMKEINQAYHLLKGQFDSLPDHTEEKVDLNSLTLDLPDRKVLLIQLARNLVSGFLSKFDDTDHPEETVIVRQALGHFQDRTQFIESIARRFVEIAFAKAGGTWITGKAMLMEDMKSNFKVGREEAGPSDFVRYYARRLLEDSQDSLSSDLIRERNYVLEYLQQWRRSQSRSTDG
ncbi:MAG TPA: J domain-containing protein [Verrucomicrobiales bacterium]|jgi:hypothetical protein|nr:J domain-containing protein [Verrucomicrobiales bacterium]HIL71275.1 J domain-containing protein [Verrucomicrobiota bacterium]